MALLRTLYEIGGQADITAVLAAAGRGYVDLGAARYSYHYTEAFDSQVSPRSQVVTHGYPPEWLDLYARADFRKTDPIPGIVMQHGAPMQWSDALMAATYSSDVAHYARQMRQHGLLHGIAIPLYGPRGRASYSSVGFDSPINEPAWKLTAALQAIAQAAHTRICTLVSQLPGNQVALSARETDILHWMAREKSNIDIATILDISPETVKTYVKRLFEKLHSKTRMGCVIAALKLGALNI